jgi:hypothetical protein
VGVGAGDVAGTGAGVLGVIDFSASIAGEADGAAGVDAGGTIDGEPVPAGA